MNRLFTLLWVMLLALSAHSQTRVVENRPYCDLRQFHFGVLVGTHLQDIEMLNVGPQQIEQEDGSYVEKLISCDQDRWDPGFNVGVLGELRLNTNFQFRIAPTMYFGNRHITFFNHTDEKLQEEHQDLKTAYIASALELIFAAPRFNNHRPYIMAGIAPVLNLSSKSNDYIQMKKSDVFAEVGIGCDFYLPFFKLRPELKFMMGLTNCFNSKHIEDMNNADQMPYAASVRDAKSKMFVLSFYFE